MYKIHFGNSFMGYGFDSKDGVTSVSKETILEIIKASGATRQGFRTTVTIIQEPYYLISDPKTGEFKEKRSDNDIGMTVDVSNINQKASRISDLSNEEYNLCRDVLWGLMKNLQSVFDQKTKK